MAKNQDKRKGSSLPFASRTLITLRKENSGRKQNKAKGGEKGGSTNMKSILKLQHLKSLAMWASLEASIPSLGALFGHRLMLMKCGDDPSLFHCQRCGTILQPGHNCAVRIEPNRTRARHGRKKSNTSTQNNVIYWCHFCSHRNVKRGTPKDRMQEICRKVKPSLISKHTNPMPQMAANPETFPQNEVEVGKTDEIASSATAVDIITDGQATPTVGRDTPIPISPATPAVRTGNTLLGGKRRKRNKRGSNKQAEPQSHSASADTEKSVSTSNKRRRKFWTSLREIAETSKQGNTQNIANLTIPFFL